MVLLPLRRGFANARHQARLWTVGASLPLSCLLSLSMVGCNDDHDSTALPGELGSNQFFYQCANAVDDIQCRNNLSAFPETLAEGASFELSASRQLGSSLFIKPASPLVVSAVAGEFKFLRPGISAFLALDNHDELRDFIHIRAVPVDEIQVQGSFEQRVTQITLAPRRRVTLTAVPLADDEELAGTLSFRWVTDNESVVRIPRRGTEISLEALEEGTALVRVALGDITTTIEVTVTASAVEPPDAHVAPSPDVSDGGPLATASDAGSFDASTDTGFESSDAASTSSPATSQLLTDASTPDGSAALDAQVQTEAEAEAGEQ